MHCLAFVLLSSFVGSQSLSRVMSFLILCLIILSTVLHNGLVPDMYTQMDVLEYGCARSHPLSSNYD
jgi:hypothetical protein